MKIDRSKHVRRQEAYQARASAARTLGRILFVALLMAGSAAAWTEPKIKAQLETGLETVSPLLSDLLEEAQNPFSNQTAELEQPVSPLPQDTVNRP